MGETKVAKGAENNLPTSGSSTHTDLAALPRRAGSDIRADARDIIAAGPLDIDQLGQLTQLPLAMVIPATTLLPLVPPVLSKLTESNLSREEFLAALHGTLMALTELPSGVGAVVKEQLHQLGLQEFLEKGASLGWEATKHAFEGASGLISKMGDGVLSLLGVTQVVEGAKEVFASKSLGDGVINALSLAWNSYDCWGNLAMCAGIVALVVGTGGVGAIGLVAAGGVKVAAKKLVKEGLEAGAKEALKKAMKELVDKLASSEVPEKAIKQLLGKDVQLTGRSVAEVGDKLAEKYVKGMNEAIQKAGGYDNIPSEVLQKIKSEFLAKYQKDFRTLYKAVKLDDVAEGATKTWIQNNRGVLKGITEGSAREQELVELISKEFSEHMESKLASRWFAKFEAGLVQEGGEAARKIAQGCRDDFVKAVTEPAKELVQNGARRAIRSELEEQDEDSGSRSSGLPVAKTFRFTPSVIAQWNPEVRGALQQNAQNEPGRKRHSEEPAGKPGATTEWVGEIREWLRATGRRVA